MIEEMHSLLLGFKYTAITFHIFRVSLVLQTCPTLILHFILLNCYNVGIIVLIWDAY